MKSVNYRLLFFLFGVVLSSCGLRVEKSPDVKEAGRISHGFIVEVQDKYPYEPFGVGGAFANTINGFLIDFQTDQEISEAQAENDIRNIYNRLIQLVNEDKVIRPFLAYWPFSEKETNIGIMFFDPRTGRFRQPPHIATIRMSNGKMRKSVVDPETMWLMSPEEYEKKYGRKFNEAEPS